jgi:glycosyltransferase involved in cell wall biosynthesis
MGRGSRKTGGAVSARLDEVTVIVPTRNERANLPAFLASLPDEVELVVVDASADGTEQLVWSLRPSRTRVLRSPAGIPAARQLGAAVARGRWLLFTDADVRFEPGFRLELMMRIQHHGFRVRWAPELAVHSLDDRRLRQGLAYKSAHSLARGLLLWLGLRLRLPAGWLASDWGYWSRGKLQPRVKPG